LLDEVVLVVSHLPLSWVFTKSLPEIILVVDVPHFLVELTHAEAALDVDEHSAQLLSLVDLDWLRVLGLADCLLL
jgi:hypothetical protein